MNIHRDSGYKDHVTNRHILSFVCPICHNKTVYDTEVDAYRPFDVEYDDLCICDECGAELYARPQYDGTIEFEVAVEECDSIMSASTFHSFDMNRIQSRVYAKAARMMKKFGFPEEEIPEYLYVDVSPYEYDGDNYIKVEVRAELSYTSMVDLADELDPIVQKYDLDAYFDQDTDGIMSAYIAL